jgi:hypothetical protein
MEKWINADSLANLNKEFAAHHQKQPMTPAERIVFFEQQNELYARLHLHVEVMNLSQYLNDRSKK